MSSSSAALPVVRSRGSIHARSRPMTVVARARHTLTAYMGVNAAAFVRFYLRNDARRLPDLWLPVAGFATCLVLWVNLGSLAKIVGAVWILLGVIIGAVRTRGFRKAILSFEGVPEDS